MGPGIGTPSPFWRNPTPSGSPSFVPERYKRMMADPFAFLRGAAAVMATDLAHQPLAGAPVQACGDCHLMNFGAFNSPEDNILFDINDFDETLPGVDFTVDVKRLAASVAVAAKAAAMSDKQARSLAASTVTAYREHMFALMELSPREIWHSRIDLEQELTQIESPAPAAQSFDADPTCSGPRSRQGRQLSASRHRAANPGSPTSRRRSSTSVRRRSGGRKIDFARGLRALPRNAHVPTGRCSSTAID